MTITPTNLQDEEEVTQFAGEPIPEEEIALGNTEEYESNPLLQPRIIEPDVVTENKYPSPFGGTIGKSSIDLTTPGSNDKMLEEYNEWWRWDRNDPQRDVLRETWTQKYHGMGIEEYRDAKRDNATTIYGHSPNLQGWANQMDNNFQALSTAGLGWADFVMDAAGTLIPGMDKIDDKWDKSTQLDNQTYQTIRSMLSIVLPSIQTGGLTNAGLQRAGVQNMPWLTKHLARLGAFGIESTIVAGLSDTSEEHNAARVIADAVPGLFGEKGAIPFPESWKTHDSDSPAVRKRKNMYENAMLSFVSVIIGATVDIKGGRKTLDWLEPLDESSAQYKQNELIKVTDPEKLIEIQKIDELLSTGGLSKQNENILINKRLQLEAGLDVIDDVDEAVRKSDTAADIEVDEAARRKLETGEVIDEIDPDISPGLLDPSSGARSVPPPGNVARNMADTTAIKNGTSAGDPAPIITESMRRKGFMVGSTSRGAVMGVAEEARDIGRFDAIVDGFRFSAKQMNAAAWDIYTSIVDPGSSLDDIRQLFLENRDVKNMLLGRFKVEHINEEQARAAAFAMRDLVDRFLGREVAESSARAMDTLGREASTLADTIKEMAPYVDDNRAMDLIIDKLEFLLDEYALNKYISGWSLRNKNWFDQVPPKELDTVIDTLTKEFTSAENAIHAKNIRFTKTLKELKKTNPLALRPLVDAFAHTNGDVDTLAKLHKFASDAITPMGMLKSPNPKQMNLFSKGVWSVTMNNVLSGISSLRAMASNSAQLILKPITGGLGHGFWGFGDGFEGLKRSAYYNGAVWETNRRALGDAFSLMKKAHKDPEMMLKAYRKDFTFKADKEWGILDDMRKVWEEEGNWGKVTQYDAAKALKQLGAHPAMRYGMTALVFPDAFTTTHLAHYLSRVKAYDDVFSEFGFADWKKISLAEKKHYSKFFDSEGLIKDDILRNVAGEVQLNLDDGLANWINEATTAYPITKYMFMFPRTSSNYIKNSASWTPISLIPGINKYSKTIYARTDDDIAQALLEHGIDMASTPNARVIFENLRAEYTGRLIFSGLLTSSLYQYAMSGNIRGNGHYNASRRKRERDNFGYETKTINIGGKWVSFKGIPGVEQVLSIIGDMAYYSSDLNEPLLESLNAKLAWTISASFLNETPLQGFQPLMEILSGNLSGFNRLAAQAVGATFIPMGSGLGVVANAIDSAQKDIEGEFHEYLMNKIPGVKSLLPDQIDIWTGDPLNDIDNPWGKVANALNPFKVSTTKEWWRQKLFEIQYDGLSKLNKDASGSYEYSTAERELIGGYIGEQQMYKELIKILNKPDNKRQIKEFRVHRSNNVLSKNPLIKLKKNKLPIYKEIDLLIRNSQIIAEQRLIDERPDIANTILRQRYADAQMKRGDIEGATSTQDKHLEETQTLLQMSK